MNYVKGFIVSLILHSFVVFCLFAARWTAAVPHDDYRRVDISTFTIQKEEPAPAAEPSPGAAKKPAMAAKPKNESKPAIKKKEKLKPLVKRAPKPKPAVEPEPKPKPLPVVAPPPVEAEPVEEAEPKYVSDLGKKEYVPVSQPEDDLPEYSGEGLVGGDSLDEASGGEETDDSAAGGTEPGSLTGPGGMGTAEYYMSINMKAIRRRIKERLEYPSIARRMGVRGITAVKFRIHTNGKADDISVYSSSGQRMLDDAAKRAVSDAAPYPVPSETVYVVMSISFSLR